MSDNWKDKLAFLLFMFSNELLNHDKHELVLGKYC